MRRLILASCILFAANAQAAFGQEDRIAGSEPAQLVGTTLMTLHDANLSGNYTVLRDLGSAAFQSRNTRELAELFAPLRKRRLDLAAAATLMPSLTGVPALDDAGRLRVKGYYPTRPHVVEFDMRFERQGVRWAVSAIAISLRAPSGQ